LNVGILAQTKKKKEVHQKEKDIVHQEKLEVGN